MRIKDEDHVLVERTRQGDKEAFGELVKRHREAVHRVAFRITRDAHDAEDLSQDAFVKAYTQIHKFRGDSSFKYWVQRIAANTSLNHLKRKKRMVFSAEAEDANLERHPVHSHSHPDKETMRREMAERIEEAIEALPAVERAVFRLAVVEEMRHQDIASLLGCAEGTVSWRLHKARKLLLDCLEPANQREEEAKL